MTLIRKDLHTRVVVQIVLDGLDSAHSRRAYARHLQEFIAWHRASNQPLSKATVQRYTSTLRGLGVSASTINQRLCAIRKLAEEAADNGALDPQIANGIRAVKGIRQAATRSGNWLVKGQAQQLLNAPDINTVKGLRDRAILALLLGCGLRRAEVANLNHDRIQERDGRWVLVDIVGKGNKIRSVPMPNWTKQAINEYTSQINLCEGRVFRPLSKAGRFSGDRVTEQAIYNIVVEY